MAALYETHRTGSRTVPPGMLEHLRRWFLEAPSCDLEIPSLVATDGDGRVVAFQGVNVTPMLLDGRPVRAAALGPLVTAQHSRGTAVFLQRRVLAGPQALTISDRQNAVAHRLFVRLGAHVIHPTCLRWTIMVRRISHVAGRLTARGWRRWTQPIVRPAALGLDRALYERRRGRSRPTLDTTTEPLSPRMLVASLPSVAGTARLRPCYDAAWVAWRFAEFQRARHRGRLAATAVRDATGTVLGWYVVIIRPRGVSDVVQLVARDGREREVLDHLAHDTWASGANAVCGRLEPQFVLPLGELPHRSTFVLRSCLLVHTADSAVLQALALGRSVLSLFDGEAWVNESYEATAL